MNRLPDELLYDIFRFFCGKHSQISRPITISHCCQRWRFVALNAPSLWAYILISGKPLRADIDRLNAWLGRSKSSLLDICIKWHLPAEECNNHLDQCLEVLSHHTSRWGTLHFETTNLSKASQTLLSTRDLPELTRLYFSDQDDGLTRPSSQQWLRMLHARMPKLQEVDVPGLAVLTESQSWPPPASQLGLKRLTIRDASHTQTPDYQLSALRAIFHAYPHLVYLDLNAAFPRAYTPGEKITGSTLMADLEIWRLCCQPMGVVCILLKSIYAPKLTSLDLNIRPIHIFHLLSNQTFPFPNLERVWLHGDELPLSDVTVRFLSYLPRLRHLVLGEFVFYNFEPKDLSHMKAIASTCPEIKHLKLHYCQGGGLGSAVQAFVEERRLRSASGTLPALRLEFYESAQYLSYHEQEWFIKTMDDVHFLSDNMDSD